MLYFAVATRRPRRRRRRSPRRTIPKQYNGMKMVRQEAFPLSGDAGISRHPRHDRAARLPPPAGAPRHGRRRRTSLDAYVEHVMSFIDPSRHQAVQRRARRRQRHGRAGRAEAVRSAALPDDAALLRDRRPLPQPRGQSAHRREPPRHRRARRRREGRHRHRLGRRRRSLLLHRRHRRVHLRRLHHGAAGRGVPAEAARRDDHLRPARQLRREGRRRRARRHGADEPRRPRVLQAAHARDQRASSAARSPGTTTSATTSTPTTASFRRCSSSS